MAGKLFMFFRCADSIVALYAFCLGCRGLSMLLASEMWEGKLEALRDGEVLAYIRRWTRRCHIRTNDRQLDIDTTTTSHHSHACTHEHLHTSHHTHLENLEERVVELRGDERGVGALPFCKLSRQRGWMDGWTGGWLSE